MSAGSSDRQPCDSGLGAVARRPPQPASPGPGAPAEVCAALCAVVWSPAHWDVWSAAGRGAPCRFWGSVLLIPSQELRSARLLLGPRPHLGLRPPPRLGSGLPRAGSGARADLGVSLGQHTFPGAGQRGPIARSLRSPGPATCSLSLWLRPVGTHAMGACSVGLFVTLVSLTFVSQRSIRAVACHSSLPS